MKALSILALLLPLSVWASEASDRADIEKTIAALNDPSAAPSAVWAPGVDGPAERTKLTGGPMSEVFGGRISPGFIEFPARRTALVHATQTQFGSLILPRTVSVLIMMKKVRGGWRIQEIRPGQ
jgi:hypothetical protein